MTPKTVSKKNNFRAIYELTVKIGQDNNNSGKQIYDIETTATTMEIPKTGEDFARIMANEYLAFLGIGDGITKIINEHYPEYLV